MPSSQEITGLLIDWSKGDREAFDQLLPLVEKELHKIARRYMHRFHPGNTLQTTVLINETYLLLVDQKQVDWQNRAHFFGIAAILMRRFLNEYLRAQRRQKRGDGLKVSLSGAELISDERSDELIALEEALCRLGEIDGRKSRVVELKFYGGLNMDEIAEVLKISKTTVVRDWTLAKAWLAREIRNG